MLRRSWQENEAVVGWEGTGISATDRASSMNDVSV